MNKDLDFKTMKTTLTFRVLACLFMCYFVYLFISTLLNFEKYTLLEAASLLIISFVVVAVFIKPVFFNKLSLFYSHLNDGGKVEK